jgi:TatD DNase family protein
MFDSHCHLHAPEIIASAHDLAVRARAVGVRGFLLAGVEPEGWRQQQSLAEREPDMCAAYGVHPQVVAEQSKADSLSMLAELEASLASEQWRRPVAIGEIGLDAARERKATLDVQEEIFRAQLALARREDLPVVLHVLDAHRRTLDILKADGLPRAGGIVHSYSGSGELVAEYVKLGLMISFAGSVTAERSKKVRAAVTRVPAAQLLVETDAPFQTPLQHRPERNQPAFLPTIIAAVAELRHEPFAVVASYTEDNARRVLRLPAG